VGRIIWSAEDHGREAELSELVQGFEWVELHASLDDPPDPWWLSRLGFGWTDVQLHFDLALAEVPELPDDLAVVAEFADERPFVPSATPSRSFGRERFAHLGIDAARVDERYMAWADQLVAELPSWCMEVSLDGRPQGWYCARPVAEELELMLTALYEQSELKGRFLYHAAFLAYARRGATIARGRFSVRNHRGHSILASLGARFKAATGVWLWRGGVADRPT
jgi:hypothetical protein